jgi:hypothetical protein
MTATLVVATAKLTAVSATRTPTSTISATVTPVPTYAHTYYLSTYRTAHYYYCDTDPAWHDLDSQYLVHLNSVADVQRLYPGRTLHEPC